MSSTTDDERLALAAKLDAELDAFIDGLERRPYADGWPEDRWQEEMEKHPFFMKRAPKEGETLSPLMEGLQQLKYDPAENTPLELANAYKDDGNFNFKHKNYRLAIISYTEGVKVKCGDVDVEAVLLNNRAAANYFLRNYRSALRDCEGALRHKPNYRKVSVRAAHCSYEIGQYDKAVEFCDIVLRADPQHLEILDLRTRCLIGKKRRERDERKHEKREARARILDNALAVVRMEGEDRTPRAPQLVEHAVRLDEIDRKLVWPVVFAYPEYRTMDFVQEFHEDDSFDAHLRRLFETPPEWDVERKYVFDDVVVYFEGDDGRVYSVGVEKSLGEILRHARYVVKGGTPSFILLLRDSPAEQDFLDR